MRRVQPYNAAHTTRLHGDARQTEPAAKLAYYVIAATPDDCDDDDDGDRIAERGYVATADFIGRTIVTAERVTL